MFIITLTQEVNCRAQSTVHRATSHIYPNSHDYVRPIKPQFLINLTDTSIKLVVNCPYFYNTAISVAPSILLKQSHSQTINTYWSGNEAITIENTQVIDKQLTSWALAYYGPFFLHYSTLQCSQNNCFILSSSYAHSKFVIMFAVCHILLSQHKLEHRLCIVVTE